MSWSGLNGGGIKVRSVVREDVIASSARRQLRTENRGIYCCLTSAGSGPSRQKPAPKFLIRSVREEDLWAVADVHASAFYPKASFLMSPLIKLDRMLSIIEGEEYEVQKRGRYVCLTAVRNDLTGTLQDPPFPLSMLAPFFPESVGRGLGMDHEARGVLGAMVMDDTGQHLPSMFIEDEGNPFWKNEQGCAYISNLAVSPSWRGMGIGRALVQKAELIAQEWGCWGIALHVNPKNEAAYKLYTGQGYVCPESAPGNFRSLGNGHKRGNLRMLVKLL